MSEITDKRLKELAGLLTESEVGVINEYGTKSVQDVESKEEEQKQTTKPVQDVESRKTDTSAEKTPPTKDLREESEDSSEKIEVEKSTLESVKWKIESSLRSVEEAKSQIDPYNEPRYTPEISEAEDRLRDALEEVLELLGEYN